MPVLVHQPVLGGRIEREAQPQRRVAQPGAGQLPERPVALAIRAAHRYQPGVFDLLVAPEHAQRFAVAREELLGQQRDAVHVEQRAVGIEQHRAGACRIGRLVHRPEFIRWPERE